MRMFWVILALYFIVQCYVLWRYYQLMPAYYGLKIVAVLGGLLLFVSLPIALFLGRDLPLWLVKPLYLIGASWAILLLYVLIPILLLDIFRIVNYFMQWVPADKITELRTHNGGLFLVMVGIYAGIIWLGNQTYHEKVRHEYFYDLTTKKAIEIGSQSEKDLNRDLIKQCAMNRGNPLKVVMISDLHLGHTIGRRELIAWRELINAENADYIFVSGDVIDNDIRPLDAENIHQELNQFQAKNGVYVILGNHEYIAGVDESLAFFAKTNWRVLRDEVILLPENIYLVGRDDKMNPHRAELSDLLVGLDPDIPMIVLDHQPVNFPALATLGTFLQFSGHTHDGQVWPYNYIAKQMNGASSGLWDFSDSQLLISAGIGIWGGKFRIGTRSDYRVVTFCQ